MGKNRDIKSVVVLLANTAVHEIVAKHTNRPESKPFLEAEAAEYRSQTENAYEKYNWNQRDKDHIRQEAVKDVKKVLSSKYPDVVFHVEEIQAVINEEMKKLEL